MPSEAPRAAHDRRSATRRAGAVTRLHVLRAQRRLHPRLAGRGFALAFDSNDVLRTALVDRRGLPGQRRRYYPAAAGLAHDDRTPEDRKVKVAGPGPLRNPGWLLTTFFGGVFWTNQVLLNIVIPLWLVEETDAPRCCWPSCSGPTR